MLIPLLVLGGATYAGVKYGPGVVAQVKKKMGVKTAPPKIPAQVRMFKGKSYKVEVEFNPPILSKDRGAIIAMLNRGQSSSGKLSNDGKKANFVFLSDKDQVFGGSGIKNAKVKKVTPL